MRMAKFFLRPKEEGVEYHLTSVPERHVDNLPDDEGKYTTPVVVTTVDPPPPLDDPASKQVAIITVEDTIYDHMTNLNTQLRYASGTVALLALITLL